MTNFFAAPLLPQQPNPEPPGWNAIRAQLMSQVFQRGANPYGMNPYSSPNAAYNPLLPSGGQGRFNPYGAGQGPGAGQGMGGGWGQQQGGGGNPMAAGGGMGQGGGNPMMQALMKYFQQMQQQGAGAGAGGGPGAPSGRVPGQVGFRGPTDATSSSGGGAGQGSGSGQGQSAGSGSPQQGDPTMGTLVPGASPGGAPMPGMMPTESPQNPSGGPGPVASGFDWGAHGMPAQQAPTVGTPPPPQGDPYSQSLTDGNPVEQTEYDGRPDAAKMMHGHTALMRAVLPALLRASAARHAAAGPPPPGMPMGGGPPPSGPAPSPTAFDGSGSGFGSGPTSGTSAPFGPTSGEGTGSGPVGGGVGSNLPTWPTTGTGGQAPTVGVGVGGGPSPTTGAGGSAYEPFRSGYDGNPAYGGFTQIRAPFSQPRPAFPMGGAPSAQHTAAGLNHILGGMGGANRRGMIEASRAGSPHSVFDGERNEYRPKPRGPAPSTEYDAATPDPTDPNNIMSVGGSSTPTGSTNTPMTPTPVGAGSAGSPGATGTTPTGTTDPNAAGYNPFPSGAETLGNPMYPWLMPYTGQRTAPMSPYQNQALGNMSGFVGGGEGLGTGYDYLSSELGGKYIGEADPYMQQIAQGAGNLKNIQDAQARQRIASSMAAGGNALSGARSAAESQYQNTSDANYQQMLGQLKLQNLTNERNLQQGAAGMLPGYANTQVSGLNSLMNAGAVPQQTEQADYNRQYNDWLRQIGGMQQADQFGQTQGLNLLKSGGYSGTNQPQYGTSAAAGIGGLLAGLLGGGSSGGGLGGLLSKLFGGGSSSGGKSSGGSSGGSAGGGGGTPGKDSSGNTPGQPGYDPATDPGSPNYNPASDTSLQGYDPTTDPNSPSYDPSSYGGLGWNDPSGGFGNPYGTNPGDTNTGTFDWASLDPGLFDPGSGGDTGGYYGDGSEGG